MLFGDFSNSRRSRKLLPGLYPALGGADARNQGGDAPLSPPLIPHWGWNLLYQAEFWYL